MISYYNLLFITILIRYIVIIVLQDNVAKVYDNSKVSRHRGAKTSILSLLSGTIKERPQEGYSCLLKMPLVLHICSKVR